MNGRDTGPWHGRVQFVPGGGLAYRPGQVLVRVAQAEAAQAVLEELREEDAEYAADEVLGGAFVRFGGLADPLQAIDTLHRAGIVAQVNHVLFATCCCPPHPASPQAGPFYANPFYANPFYANPFYANPFYANPFYANPFYANPFYANAAGCCCCGSGGSGANPFYANPFYANADPHPASNPTVQSSGRRSSSARPADQPPKLPPGANKSVRIAVLDTGYADGNFQPGGLSPNLSGSDFDDVPDEDGDQYLDPAAGHGTFIAGVIEQLTPGCAIRVIASLSTYGDGDEVDIAEQLAALARLPEDERPHLVNLSFGGYTPLRMDVLAEAVAQLHQQGAAIVASAGNDGTCLPMYPAALPEVVGVAALHRDGTTPAPFSNFGPWVRACTVGVDVVSTFFDNFDGPEGPDNQGVDTDDFHGWATWSGTSFAAPRVVAALARLVEQGAAAQDAVQQLIEDPKRDRIPMMGTIVLPG